MLRLVLPFLTLLAFAACKPKQSIEERQKELRTGKLDKKNIYTVNEIGWSVRLPADWKVATRREQSAMNEKGEKLMEESFGVDVNTSGVIPLVTIQKDQLNFFSSNMQAFDGAEYGTYDDRYVAITEAIKEMYKRKNIPAEFELGATRIDGLPFDRFITKIYSPGKKKIILYQQFFSYEINGYDFSMIINYNDEDNEEALMKIVNSSRFSIKE